jgi:hypothetical protein
VSTTSTTLVILWNCIDLQSGELNGVIRVQLDRVGDVTEEGNREPATSPVTDPRVGLMLLSVYLAS